MGYLEKIINTSLIFSILQIILGVFLPRIKDWIIPQEKFKEKSGKLKETIIEKVTILNNEQMNYYFNKFSTEDYINFEQSNESILYTKKLFLFYNTFQKSDIISKRIFLFHKIIFYSLLIGILLLVLSCISSLFNFDINSILFYFILSLIFFQILSAIFINSNDRKFDNLEHKIYYEN